MKVQGIEGSIIWLMKAVSKRTWVVLGDHLSHPDPPPTAKSLPCHPHHVDAATEAWRGGSSHPTRKQQEQEGGPCPAPSKAWGALCSVGRCPASLPVSVTGQGVQGGLTGCQGLGLAVPLISTQSHEKNGM